MSAMICDEPNCKYDNKKQKCIKPNPYIETLKECKKQDVTQSECREFYQSNREKLTRNACSLFHSKNSKALLKIRDKEEEKGGKENNRITNYHLVTNILDKIHSKQCLEPRSMNININEIDIKKAFGTKSNYGMAYLANIYMDDTNKKNAQLVAIKIMPDNVSNRIEIDILKTIKDKVLKKQTIHFPLMYKVLECPTEFNKRVNETELPKDLKHQKYHMVINELAKGDLKMFLNDNKHKHTQNTALLQNALTQIFFSIAIFHQSLNKVHLDCHWGNFLYHEVPAGGYLHYKVGKKDIYIPNMGYVWVIWDFGFAKKRLNNNIDQHVMKDYYRILHAFIPNKNNGWLSDTRQIDPDFVDTIRTMRHIMKNKGIKQNDKNIIELAIKHLKPNEKKKKNMENNLIHAGSI